METELLQATKKLHSGRAGRAQRREFDAGRLVRLAAGSYVGTAEWVQAGPRGRFLIAAAAYAARHPSAVFSHASALALIHERFATPSTLDVLVSGRGHLGRHPSTFAVNAVDDLSREAAKLDAPRLVGRDGRDVDPSTHRNREGLRFVAPEPALLGLLSAGGPLALANADAARAVWQVRPDGFNESALLAAAAELKFGAQRDRAAALWKASTHLSDSVGESISRFHILDQGFPAPILQQAHIDQHGLAGYSDFWWPWLKLIGEFDGIAKYMDPEMGRGRSTFERIRREKERDNRLQAMGIRTLHWGWSEANQPAVLRARLLRAGLVQDQSLRPWP